MGFFLFLFPVNFSAKDLNQDYKVAQNYLDDISSSSRWHRILDYSKNKLEILDQNFYLTDVNNFDPKLELIATLEEYGKFIRKDSEFICANPSRAILLTYFLNELPRFDASRCKDYFGWSKEGNINSISFMYVTGYLKNPASFFGHTLIKFNTLKGTQQNNLLDSTLNYGADTNNDPAVPYVFKGLTGLYKASLQEEKFYRLSALYQEFQMRDIYEYRLRLSKFQRELIISYTYEMSKKEYKYYFLSDNCAFRMNLVLELALDKDLMPNLPWAAPIDLLMALSRSDAMEEIIYHPSQTTKVYAFIEDLDSFEKNLFFESIKERNYSLQKLKDYPSKVKLALLETLNHKKLKSFKDDDYEELQAIDEKRKQLLLSLDNPDRPARRKLQSKSFPHEANKPTLVRYRLKKIDTRPDIHSFQLRASNFELLDNDNTRSLNSSFLFLSPTVSFSKNKVYIDEIALFKVLSLNDSKNHIPGEKNFSWGIEVMRKNLSEFCYPCRVNSFTGTLGKSFRVNDSTSLFLLANASFHNSITESGNVSFSLNSGMIVKQGVFNFVLDYKKIEFESENIFDDEEFNLAVKFNLSSSRDFSIGFKDSSNLSSLYLNINKYF